MKKFLLLFLFISIHLVIKAQEYSGVSKAHKIQSEAFEKAREIRVWVPFSYTETKESYPIIYLFDGQFDALFDMTTGISDYMSQTGLASEYIIVGIKTEDRPKEFTPKFLNPKTGENWKEKGDVGNAKLLEIHLQKEVFPFVEKQYRTTPFRVAIGHSLGATFLLNSILDQPSFFKSIIAISPNTTYDFEQLVTRFSEFTSKNKVLNKTIYISTGTAERLEEVFKPSTIKLDSVLKNADLKGLNYRFEVLDGLNHSETPIVSIPKGMNQISKIWNLSEAQQEHFLKDTSDTFINHLKAFYKNKSKWAGYTVIPSADEANGFGYFVFQEGDAIRGLEVIDWGLELHPDNVNLYDSKGEMLEAKEKYKDASVYYKKALDKLETKKEAYDEENYNYYKAIYLKNFERVNKLL